MTQSSKGLFIDGSSVARVDIPRSLLEHFAHPQVHIRVEKAAELLGFPGEKEFRKYAEPLLRKTEEEPLGTHIGALAFKRLVALCASKTAAARKLLEEFMSSWQVVNLPSAPLAIDVRLPMWPGCLPEAVGMDRAPFERLYQYFQWRTRMRHWAGMACGVVKGGKLVYYQESGYRDVENKVKMTGDTIMRLFSMTKCLVAAAFMAYYEDPSFGIDLDDPLSKYLPAFEASKMSVLPKRGQKENQPLDRPITIRNLLSHTSGIGYGATLGDDWPPVKGSYYKIYEDLCNDTKSGTIDSLDKWCTALAKVPLKGQPGTFWDYSFSLDVLGLVLEVIAGKPLDVIVEEKICGPLGMRDTRFDVPSEHADRIGPWYQAKEVEGKPNMAHVLSQVDQGGAASGWVGSNVSPILSAGGTVEVPLAMKGGMVSTFNDYLRFLLMLRNLGELDGVRVLKTETVQLMCNNHIPVACNGKKTVYVFDKPGMGFCCLGAVQAQHPKQDRGSASGEYGWGGLAGPAWTIDPRSDMIVLSMTQTALVLDHEEYLRYTARRAISQHHFGSVYGPTKATSYHPESFDVVRPKQDTDKKKDDDPNTDKEFEEEHQRNMSQRIRGAKECAILPGARLERHPSDETEVSIGRPGAQEAAEERQALEEGTPAAKRQRRSQDTPAEAKQATQRPTGSSPPSAKKGASPTASEGVVVGQELLFSRVQLTTDNDEVQKARVTKVRGNSIEVVTEGSWSSQKVKVGDISVIDETQMGMSQVRASDPKDFPTMGA